MNFKYLVLGTFILLALSTDIVYADQLCVSVRTHDGSSASFATVTLGNWTADTDREGYFCFRGVSSGTYQIIVQWRGQRFFCQAETSKSNTCSLRLG